jgi:hypothetical protein
LELVKRKVAGHLPELPYPRLEREETDGTATKEYDSGTTSETQESEGLRPMTANELRNQWAHGGPVDETCTPYYLMEIAAQLAELNFNLVALDSALRKVHSEQMNRKL